MLKRKHVAAATFLLCSCNLTWPLAQSAHKSYKPPAPPKGARAPQPLRPERAHPSSVGISLEVITEDGEGGIWIGGSVWLLEGLLVRVRQGVAEEIPLPEVRMVQDLIFTDASRAWMIASGHLMRAKGRDYRSWKKVTLAPEAPYLTSISFPSPTDGWVAGWDGVIYHTNDGGASWHKQESGTSADFMKITFVNESRGWAQSATGIYATADGGRTWGALAATPMYEPAVFVDERHGWKVGEHNDIFHTRDGGRTWTKQYAGGDDQILSFFFSNPREGWAVGDVLLHTDDGGRSWRRVYQRPESDSGFARAVFVNPHFGWAIPGLWESQQNVYFTTNGGQTWASLPDDWKRSAADRVYSSKFGKLQ